jgi:hypothetical protein
VGSGIGRSLFVRGLAGARVATAIASSASRDRQRRAPPVTISYLHYGQVPQLHGVFRGLNAAVVALVLSVAYRLGKSSLKSTAQVVLAAVALGAALLHTSPVTVVLACGAIGALFLTPQPKVVP